MSVPKETFKVYSVRKIDFKNKTFDNVRFFKEPTDAMLLRNDLERDYGHDFDIMFIVEYCDRSEII